MGDGGGGGVQHPKVNTQTNAELIPQLFRLNPDNPLTGITTCQLPGQVPRDLSTAITLLQLYLVDPSLILIYYCLLISIIIIIINTVY